MSINWTGVFPALTTKFTADDKLDLPLFEKNLNAQLQAGVNGIVLGGTLGEASVLPTAGRSSTTHRYSSCWGMATLSVSM